MSQNPHHTFILLLRLFMILFHRSIAVILDGHTHHLVLFFSFVKTFVQNYCSSVNLFNFTITVLGLIPLIFAVRPTWFKDSMQVAVDARWAQWFGFEVLAFKLRYSQIDFFTFRLNFTLTSVPSKLTTTLLMFFSSLFLQVLYVSRWSSILPGLFLQFLLLTTHLSICFFPLFHAYFLHFPLLIHLFLHSVGHPWS